MLYKSILLFLFLQLYLDISNDLVVPIIFTKILLYFSPFPEQLASLNINCKSRSFCGCQSFNEVKRDRNYKTGLMFD